MPNMYWTLPPTVEKTQKTLAKTGYFLIHFMIFKVDQIQTVAEKTNPCPLLFCPLVYTVNLFIQPIPICMWLPCDKLHNSRVPVRVTEKFKYFGTRRARNHR